MTNNQRGFTLIEVIIAIVVLTVAIPVGLAVHDDNVTTRFHYVSLPMKLSLGKKEGHINAVELK